ncbi:MAG TPA: hypothetical protein VGB85_15750, partial [Nannocystis sp.]
MTRSSLYLLLGAGLALTAACGDDNAGESGASASEGATDSATGVTGVTGSATDADSATDPTTGMSASMSSTEDPTGASTTDVNVTEGSSSGGGDTEASTTGPVDPGTTTDVETTDPGTTTDAETSTTGPDSTTGDSEECPLSLQHMPCDGASDDALHALGLNCTTAGNQWINNDNAVAVAKLDFQAPPPSGGRRTWQVAKSYGTHVDPNTNKPFWGPREGEKVLLIS